MPVLPALQSLVKDQRSLQDLVYLLIFENQFMRR